MVTTDKNINRGEKAAETREDNEGRSALARKADALEAAGGDPAKVNELRHQAPAVRHGALTHTTESNLTVRDAAEYAKRREAEAQEIADKEGVKPEDLAVTGKAPKGRLDASRGKTAPPEDTPKKA